MLQKSKMMLNQRFNLVVILFSCFILLPISSCKKQGNSKALTASVSNYVYAFTAGIISKATPIKIRFTNPAISADQIGENLDKGILRFQPDITGTTSWEDEQTLLFTPEESLASATTYVGKVKLKKIFPDAPKDAESFEFEFRTKDQYLELNFQGLNAPNPKDLSQQELLGNIYSTDVTESIELEKVLQAQQNGQNLKISWNHSPDQLQHAFTISGIQRSNTPSKVTLSWDGNPLNIKQKGREEIEVPSLSDFKVLKAQIIQDQEQYIQLNFSDPLQANQSLEGLVNIADYRGNYRFIINGNQLRVYPVRRLVGSHKIKVNTGIKNTNGKRMQDPSEWFIEFEDVKPQVRLAGKGVIMPNSNGLIFPFEAVSLNAVEIEVFKIFNNNILQFLQSNQLDGTYDLHRVGRVIMQKRVDLKSLNPNAKSSEWTRYALDLKDLIDQDDEAIYQIRIGFRSNYSNYYCEQAKSTSAGNEELTIMEDSNDQQEFESIMDSWYGIDGYYPEYNWKHREDPCFPAYYNSRRFIKRNIIASNLGIIAKGAENNNYFVSVSDLRSTEPISSAQLEFYDYQQQLLTTAQTNGEGFANVNLSRKPFVLIAKQGNQKGYLRLEDGNALSLSRFDVAGSRSQKGLKGFIYGERGVWRPGDSVYLHFILEDKGQKLPKDYPISFELYDARGQLQERRASTENVSRVYPIHFATTLDAPTGNWRAVIQAGGATFEKSLKIETVKPNRLKIDLDFGAEEISSSQGAIPTRLQVNWLHGAPASNLKAKVEVQLSATNTTFEKYKNFEFDDPARSFESEPRILFDGTLDGTGNTSFNTDLTSTRLLPGKLKANFKTRAFEKSGEFSTDNQSVPYSPFASFAGVSIPENKYGEKRLDIDKAGKIGFVAVDEKGVAISNKTLKIGLYRVQWRWWWDRGYDNVSRYNTSNHFDALQQTNVSTNSKGEANWAVTVNEWGRYLVRVCDPETGHCAGDYFYAGYPWYGDDEQARDAAAMLAFSADKETYNVGERVKLTIPTGEEGRALVTLENGSKVVKSFWVKAKKGENQIEFETTPEMAPTIYAHVALTQPHAQALNDLPIRMYGVIPVKVEDANTRLNPELKMPDVLQPEKEVTVEVSESKGKAMTYTLAVVDEGLLGLTRFKTPNPWDVFYAREALGVKTWDVYDQVLGAYGGELERILSLGGDLEVRKNAEDDRANRFQPVVLHLGPFQLKKGKKAKHKITMPNYVGAVRTMVVATQEGAYGSTEKTTPVRKPLMVLATLPRVLGPGEQLSLPVNVFAMESKVKNVQVKISESSGLIKMLNGNAQNLQFNRPGDQLATFDIQVSENIGVAKFTITAEGGGESAKQDIEIQVRNPNPFVTDVIDAVVEAGKDWSTEYAPIGMQGSKEAILEVSSIPPINLGERLAYLLTYPYGCLEQTLSGGFPQLYVNKLLDLDEKEKNRANGNIKATIDRLKQFQTSQGGFAYWPGESTPNHWASSYAGHFLLEAKALGYSVQPSMIDRWIKFQKSVARKWDPKNAELGFYSISSDQLSQAYRLYTLALAQKPDLAAMNRLRETKNLGLAGKWRLAAAYALSGKNEIAQALIKNLPTDIPEYTELSYTYGSSLRDQAMVLETFVLMKDKVAAAKIVKSISEQLSQNRWYSTQTVAYSLLAVGKYAAGSQIEDQLTFAYQIQGQQNVNAGSNSPVMNIALPVETKQSIQLSNTSKSTLFARIILRGQPIAGNETPSSSDLQIAVNYKDVQGNTIDPSNLSQGTDFIAEVKVTHPGNRAIPYKEMALAQIFPSGWEILNTRMDGVQNFTTTSKPRYQDFRDDRVNTFFDINQGKTQTYRVQLNAAYQGKFYLPAVNCEAMYDYTINAREPGRWVEVTGAKSI